MTNEMIESFKTKTFDVIENWDYYETVSDGCNQFETTLMLSEVSIETDEDIEELLTIFQSITVKRV